MVHRETLIENPLVRRLSTVAAAVADLLLPICCVACDALVPASEKGIVCGSCWSRARELPHPRCMRCGHPADAYSCRWCPLLPPFVRAARSWCWMGTGTGEQIVYALKYEGWKRAAIEMAERMSRLTWPPDVMRERAALVPVPLSGNRMRDRGFNQSGEIANALALKWEVPVWHDVLARTRATVSQTELTPGERLSNVAGAFSVPREKRATIARAHLVLVDDVVTTGATLRACASALFAAGTRTISYMTFGRAPASGDRLFPGKH